ncbi:hypothetical protein [Paraflavitalea speifideaquila]|uniref:hypothetical protein n=1 Tax=Paraflavitalea speifideaquila TaxID=3076558 RepID=UPI0028E1E6F2|nr:hypothetical protein [Paraflavitalea speifideiaquila]
MINDGKGHFADQISTMAPALQKAGMVTDAAWVDLDGDHKNDLVITGEWMPVQVYLHKNNGLQESSSRYFDKNIVAGGTNLLWVISIRMASPICWWATRV